jgi:hypothetical protein
MPIASRLDRFKCADNEQVAPNVDIKLLRLEPGHFDADSHRSPLVPDLKSSQRIDSLFFKDAIEEANQTVSQSDEKCPATTETEAIDRIALLRLECACLN